MDKIETHRVGRDMTTISHPIPIYIPVSLLAPLLKFHQNQHADEMFNKERQPSGIYSQLHPYPTQRIHIE